MRVMRKRPDVMAKLDAHLHGPGNPFRNPEIQARGTAAARSLGYGHLNGGNGRPPTVAQKLLADRLGWPVEVIVRTGRSSPWPKFYALDVAHGGLMVAVECDGNSHLSRAVRERDARKDGFLTELGWIVLRFPNQQILVETDTVLNVIRSTTSRRARGTS